MEYDHERSFFLRYVLKDRFYSLVINRTCGYLGSFLHQPNMSLFAHHKFFACDNVIPTFFSSTIDPTSDVIMTITVVEKYFKI